MPYSVPPPAPAIHFLQPEPSAPIAALGAILPPPAPADLLPNPPEASPQPHRPDPAQSVPATARAADLGTSLEINANSRWQSVPSPVLDELAQSPPTPSTPLAPAAIPSAAPPPAATPPATPPATNIPPAATPPAPAAGVAPPDPSGTGSIVELNADYQEFDTVREVFTGVGRVEMRFRGSVLTADRVQVNLPNRIAVAEGNAQLVRGDQILRGNRFEYNFVQSEGIVLRASGEVFLPTANNDFSSTLSTDASAGAANQPPTVVSSSGGLNIGLGNSGNTGPAGGSVRRLRFEADRIDFTSSGWVASNIRITNDPFSPPELELRANTATFTRLSPTRSEIRARNPRLVFDQGFALPLLINRVVLDDRQRDATLVRFGYDAQDRGGLFVETAFTPLSLPGVQFTVRPQVFLQRALTDSSSPIELRNFGVVSSLNVTFGPTTTLGGNFVLTSLDPSTFGENLRASLRLRQLIGRYTLSFESSYRDRLFNGSLGYQNVQSSIGFIFTSPRFRIGDTGISYSYQAGAQHVNANTDRAGLLDPIRDNDRITLQRYQASVAANRPFVLWQGQPLPATPTQGLRYTPNPIVPYLIIVPSTRAIVSAYSNGDSQTTLTGSLGLYGQFGHFSRPFLDYTAFNLTYSQSLIEGSSPFLFDRDVDERVVSAGIVQQIYGPFRLGLQTSINLDRNRSIDTDFTLEYSRRTFAIVLRYNPERQIGSLGLRISDFNWGTAPEPFSGSGGTVSGGVQRTSE